MKRESPGETPLPDAYNEYLRREIERLETERDAIDRELRRIRHSYAWKLVDGYRRWLGRHRDNAIVRAYERLAVWILDRSLLEPDEKRRYQHWLRAHELTRERIESIRAEIAAFPYHPLLSVMLHVGGALTEDLLAAAIDSIRGQLYDNWELRVVGDGTEAQTIEAMLARYVAADPRIVMGRVSGSNGAAPPPIDQSILPQRSPRGEFICFLDQRDRLSVDAFYAVVKRLNRSPLDDLFYWDEDQVDSAGQRIEPFFKPDWNPDLLLSMNYLGECFVIRTTLAEKLRGLRREFAPSQIYDLLLRAVEQTDRIVHLPEVLSHRRDETMSPDRTSESDRQSARAIEEALQRRGEPGRVDVVGPGLFAARYDTRGQPLISILIPTRDKFDLLRQCLESIYRLTDYKNYEIIILDNDSAESETLDYFRQIAGKVQVHRCPGRFNFSAINNLGTTKAKGEFLLFLNNDTQVLRPDWLRALIEQAQRPQVGAVGAKLLFADGRIQHAGVVLGIGGLVGHAFRFTAGNARHYFGLSDVIRDCSAVTAACMMMRRSVFVEVGGFDEKFEVDFADIDLCLRLQARGYRIVYSPLALLHHHESASRRRMQSPADHEAFVTRWGECLRKIDPFYSQNLTLSREDWTIAR